MVRQVDFELLLGVGVRHERVHGGFVENDWQHGVLEAVVEEDVGKGGGDDASNAEVINRPRRVLTRRPATKIVTGDQNGGVAVRLVVQHEIRAFDALLVVTHFVKRRDSEAGALDRLQELLGDDHIGVDVLKFHGRGYTLQGGKLGHAARARRTVVLLLRRRGSDQGVR